jgi:crotonobetainyl-CoA:carnitine CoA-transferase CaiB-like acyl-CoA transferase
MHILNKKSRWQRLVQPVTAATPGRGVIRSGLVTAGTMAGVTVASAVISALRHSQAER